MSSAPRGLDTSFAYLIIHSFAVFGPNNDEDFFWGYAVFGNFFLHFIIVAFATASFFTPGISSKIHSQKFDGPNIPANALNGIRKIKKKTKYLMFFITSIFPIALR